MTGAEGTKLSDLELIDAFKQGDKSAFEILVVRHQRKIYGLAYRITGLPDEAQELAQEIFIKVFKKLHTFRGDSAFTTWLYQVAANTAKNRLKYLKRRHYYRAESMDEPLHGKQGDLEKQYVSNGPSPDEQLDSARLQQLVQEKLGELPDEQRIVLTLRDIQGMEYDQIAEITGLALGTVKSRIHRGRLELKKLLEPYMARQG